MALRTVNLKVLLDSGTKEIGAKDPYQLTAAPPDLAVSLFAGCLSLTASGGADRGQKQPVVGVVGRRLECKALYINLFLVRFVCIMEAQAEGSLPNAWCQTIFFCVVVLGKASSNVL